jgi:hypothetical protein
MAQEKETQTPGKGDRSVAGNPGNGPANEMGTAPFGRGFQILAGMSYNQQLGSWHDYIRPHLAFSPPYRLEIDASFGADWADETFNIHTYGGKYMGGFNVGSAVAGDFSMYGGAARPIAIGTFRTANEAVSNFLASARQTTKEAAENLREAQELEETMLRLARRQGARRAMQDLYGPDKITGKTAADFHPTLSNIQREQSQ